MTKPTTGAGAELFDIPVTTLEGHQVLLREYAGKVLLVVNVASHCGFTPQYEGLEALYRKRRDQGLAVLGFPCNQFGAQEPGSAEEIRSFCDTRFGVSFPLFAKIDVNGPGTHPLYVHLKARAPGILATEAIKWNFTKFLIDRQGKVIERFAPATKPEELEVRIAELLAEQPATPC